MNWMVLESLAPVALLIGTGVVASKLGWVKQEAVKGLSDLVFLLLTPALMFRTMGQVRLEQLDFTPVAAYFAGIAVLFGGIVLGQGFGRRAVVLALAGTYSNAVMIGTALVSLVFGPQGLVTLLTLISVHALVMLTLTTLVLELAVQRDQEAQTSARWRGLVVTVGRALKSTLLHPVPLPILLGLAFAQTGLVLPEVIDKPLALLAQAFAPLALVLVGVTLAFTRVGSHWRGALALTGVKNLLHPLLVWMFCALLGVQGLPATVMVLTAALPIGANVFLFAQRYGVAQDLVTASVAVSTALALVSLTAVLLLLS
jgi:malonate transporter